MCVAAPDRERFKQGAWVSHHGHILSIGDTRYFERGADDLHTAVVCLFVVFCSLFFGRGGLQHRTIYGLYLVSRTMGNLPEFTY